MKTADGHPRTLRSTVRTAQAKSRPRWFQKHPDAWPAHKLEIIVANLAGRGSDFLQTQVR